MPIISSEFVGIPTASIPDRKTFTIGSIENLENWRMVW